MNGKAVILITLVLAVALSPAFLSEQTDAAGDDFVLTWDILEPSTSINNGKAMITGSSVYPTVAKPLIIPATVEKDGKVYNVTAVKAEAFANRNVISSVTLPITMVSVGDSAFRNCYNVKELHFEGKIDEDNIGLNAFAFGYYQNYPAECNVYGFTPIRDVGVSGNPYEDVFGKYTTVHYMDVQPDSRDAIIHIILISLGVFVLLYMGRSVRVKRIKRKKIKAR